MDDADTLGPEDPPWESSAPDAPGRLRDTFTAPEVLALASLVLAVISLLGLGLLNGSAYLHPSFQSSESAEALNNRAAAAALLGAALALLPAACGVWALRRLAADSELRVVAGTGTLLAVVAVVMRLAVAAVTATIEAPVFAQL